MFVEQAGQVYLAHWIEYSRPTQVRTHLAVVDYVPTLLPRGKVALGLRASQYDLTFAQASAWLVAAGYTIVRQIDPDASAT